MWAVAAVLLGVVLLAFLLGFHIGPHGHAAAGAVGVLAAVWLLIMAFSGRSAPLLWVLFGTDLALSGGVGILAWKGLKALHEPSAVHPTRIEGQFGVADTALEPDGLVRVHGESWSATSMNGNFPAGARVQVIGVDGVRLEVWGEDVIVARSKPLEDLGADRVGDDPNGVMADDRKTGSH